MKLMGRKRRHLRIRKKVSGTEQRPRLCVFRSNRHIYAQVIDDTKHRVLFGIGSLNLKELSGKKKTDVAFEIGKKIGQTAIDKGIAEITFDRAGYRYHGRIKSLAEGARKAGLKF
jgi:large subunit ribosomal protein L18